MENREESIRQQLESIAEEIADLALERLRENVETGDPKAVAVEKRFSRARRAVVKAAHLLAEEEAGE